MESESTSGSSNATKLYIGFVRGAGEISKPPAVSLAVAAMSIRQIQAIGSSLSFGNLT
jgi:hypothetical protein